MNTSSTRLLACAAMIVASDPVSGNIGNGFKIVGPFVNDDALAAYVEAEIDTSTHWAEAEMAYVPGQIKPEPVGDAGSGGAQQEAPAAA